VGPQCLDAPNTGQAGSHHHDVIHALTLDCVPGHSPMEIG
jgi:hypothetical protein